MQSFFEIADINPQSTQSMIPRSESARKFPSIFIDEEKNLGNWKKYLEDTLEADNLAQADNLFDLVEQSVIDEDCETVIDELDIPEETEPKILSVIRTIITIYSKNEQKRYRVGNGWVPLLSRLVKKNPEKLPTYIAFKRMRDNYVPEPGTHGYVLRLLLMYHDPELCNMLDNDKFSLAKYTELWVNSLFAGTCVESVLKSLWAYLFKHDDPFKIFFVILSIIINKRAKIIEMRFDAKEKIGNAIQLFPRFMDAAEVREIISSAGILDTNTPPFFKELFKNFMFGRKREKKPDNLPEYLPSSAFQVISNIHGVPPYIDFHYFIADCRPYVMYENGRFAFKHNFHIDCDLVSEWSSAYLNAALKTLKSMVEDFVIEEPNKVKHICVMGSGLQGYDPCIQNVITALLHKNTKYVSILYGGYNTVHQLLKLKNELNYSLRNHVENKCVFCNPVLLQTGDEQSVDNAELYQAGSSKSGNAETPSLEQELNIPGKIKQKLRQTGQDIKNQFMSCVNPQSPSCEGSSKGLSGGIKLPSDNIYEDIETAYGKGSMATDSDIYGVFNLNDITTSNVSLKPDEISLEPQFQPVLIDQWTKTPDVEKVFKCREILTSGRTYASRLIVTHTNIILLRRIDQKSKNKALLILNCPILYILKISGSSKNKDFMTITFDMTGTISVPYDKVKLLLPGKEKFMNLINNKFGINK
ncbi:TBC1 domain family member 23-like [Chelonus insularis]|uniref:TBC1 domain family member 23-like n=1 Tax=Chelonus insularis TaxID=460826 RepID=UPI00158847AC|nr:TBC1 domain family member 23-like [Chelonus insularis]